MSKNLTSSKSREHARPYVYALLYPDERIFYIGKGVGKRIYEHETEARNGGQSQKCKIIREIWSAGQKIERRILRYFDTHEDAFRYESHLISTLGGLANIQNGRQRYKDIIIAKEDIYTFGVSIAHYKPNGEIYFLAREVSDFLGYVTWAAFSKVLMQSRTYFQNLYKSAEAHFRPIYKKIYIGYSHERVREIKDYEISVLAFHLILMRSDSSKYVVQRGKSIIAYNEYCTSVIEQLGKAISPMETSLLLMALKCNVQAHNLPTFLDAGYIGLYGLTEEEVRLLKECEAKDLWKRMNRIEWAANNLRVLLTEEKLLRDDVHDEDTAIRAHYFVGEQLRKAIEAMNGPIPEDLPPASSIRKMVEDRRRSGKKRKLKSQQNEQRTSSTLGGV